MLITGKGEEEGGGSVLTELQRDLLYIVVMSSSDNS